jgi:hypothetical protein
MKSFVLVSDSPVYSPMGVMTLQIIHSCVGIQKHFMGAEIPGFGLPNRFFSLTTSCFFRDGIVNRYTIKLNNLYLIIVLRLRIELKPRECQSGQQTSKLPRQYTKHLQ